MSLGNCIPGLIEAGKMTPKQGERAKATYERHYRRLNGTMGPIAAAAEASEAALRELAYEAKQAKRRKLLAVAAQRSGAADLKRYRGKSPYAAVRAMMDNDVNAPYANVETGAERIELQSHAGLKDFLNRHSRDFLGRARDKAGMNDIVRELHGAATGNPVAREFSAAIAAVFETLRRRFNAAGGAIARLEGWGMPHAHDALRVRKAGYERWSADIKEEIDVPRMVDPETGGGFTPETLEEALRGAYAAIRSNGLIGEAGSGGGSSLANRRADHRFFVFKDGDAWLRYQAKYGSGDPFTAIMGHIRGMSKDISMMERFGPNPDATVKWLLDSADRIEAQGTRERPGAISGSSGGRHRTEKLWRYIKGEFNAPVFPEGPIAEKVGMAGVRILAGTRDLIAAAWLGSAPLSAISDINTQMLARRFNGLPQTGVLKSYLRMLDPTNPKHRDRAIRLGLGARDKSRALTGLSRYMGETHGPEITSIIADDVLRISGLNKFTEAGQRGFGDDFLRELGGERGNAFDQLEPDHRTAMERYGIDAATWEKIRTAAPYVEDGVEYLDWQTIDRRAADRLMDMVLGETQSAVQASTASARARMVADRPGTITGELSRNIFQFKSFGVSLLMGQAQRIASLPPGQRWVYGAQFLVGMTMFGAIALQMREIAKGRDPRPMESGEFWMDALVQGGGLGIFGDLFGGFNNDRIGSVLAFTAGPIGTLGEDIKQNVLADWKAEDEDEHKGRHGVRLAQRYTPGTNLWYARLMFERLIWNNLAEMTDPDYQDGFDRLEQTAEDQGQGLWWRPGESAPEAAPDLAAALAAPPETE